MDGVVVKWVFGNHFIREVWSENKVMALTGAHSASVHTLISPSLVPWVRKALASLEWKSEFYVDFFMNLLRIKSVTIIDDEPCITLGSIMNIQDPETWAEWELGVDSFVRLVDMPRGALHDENLPGYIMNLLHTAEIDFALHVRGEWDDSRQHTTPLAEVVDFDPLERFAAREGVLVDDYDIALNLEDPENGAYTAADRYLEPHTLPLLHMMIDIAIQAMNKGYAPSSESSIEISQYQIDQVTTISMTFCEMIREIDIAIIKNWPLYAINYPDQAQLRNMIYGKFVEPRILPYEIDGYDPDGNSDDQ